MQNPIGKLNASDRKNIFEFLKNHPVGVLATTSPDGKPYASTIYIAVDDTLQITFTTKRETHKYRNISEHNAVMLVVYDAKSQTAVQVSGQAIEVTNPEEQHAIYQGTLRAAKKTGKDIVPPIAKVSGGPFVGFTIKIDDIWLSDYGWGDTFAKALKHIHDPRPSGDPA